MSNLREEIAKQFYLLTTNLPKERADEIWGTAPIKPIDDWRNAYIGQADSILALISQHFDELARERGYWKHIKKGKAKPIITLSKE